MLCIKLHPLTSKMHPPKIKNAPPSKPLLHPLNGFLSKLESFAKRGSDEHLFFSGGFAVKCSL